MSKSLPTDPPPDDSSPSGAHVSASALDFLLIELVPVAQRVTERVHAREQALIDEYRRSKLLRASAAERPRSAAAAAPADSSEDADTDGDAESDAADAADAAASEKRASVLTTATTATMRTATATATATASSPRQSQPEPAITSLGFPALGPTTKDSLFRRLESQGHRVGQGLVESFSLHRPRPQTPLDAIKFLCKDLWPRTFRKPIDNLKTNHRGIFVLTDTRFQPLSRVSVDRRAGPRARDEAIARAQLHLFFPCGIIRGVLSGLGIEATVSGDSSELPMATFQIKTAGAKQ